MQAFKKILISTLAAGAMVCAGSAMATFTLKNNGSSFIYISCNGKKQVPAIAVPVPWTGGLINIKNTFLGGAERGICKFYIHKGTTNILTGHGTIQLSKTDTVGTLSNYGSDNGYSDPTVLGNGTTNVTVEVNV